jgi:dihydrofolate reductase
MISIIVAVSEDLGIGKNNDLLWYIPDDLKRFKSLTYGKTVIMGRRTWESLPRKPLSGRKNIVITDIPDDYCEGAQIVHSVSEALDKCKAEDEIFIIGGGSIYKQFMPLADRLYITHVHEKMPADVFFPWIDPGEWEIINEAIHKSENAGDVPYTFIIYDRKSK